MRALNPSPKQSATTSMRRSRKRLPASAFSAWDRKDRVDELKIRLAERDRRQATDSAIRLQNRPAFCPGGDATQRWFFCRRRLRTYYTVGGFWRSCPRQPF